MPSLGSRLARGGETAFAELYDAAADRLYRYLTKRLGSHDLAADVVQATFVRAVEHHKRFAKIANPTAYLFQIARNESARSWSRAQRNAPSPLPAEPICPSDETFGQDDAEVIVAALGRLDPHDRELVELKIYAELTFQEIADTTGLPPGTVATRYRRALESLKPWLTKQFL